MLPRPILSATTVCYPLSVSPAFTLERACGGIADAGLFYIELVAIPGYCEHLQPDRMGKEEVEEVRRLLRDHGLTPNAVNVAANLTTGNGVAFLGEAMRVAQDLQIRTVVTHIEQADTPERMSRFRALLPRILNLAEQYDIVVALETHGGPMNTGVEGARVLKELNAERLKMTYDMANVVYRGGTLPENDLAEMGEDIGRYVAHVHLKDKANMRVGDYDFPPFGEGILDFGQVLALLDGGGYRGPMTLEVELDGKPSSPEIVDRALAQSREYLEQFWEEKSDERR